ncbi:MAG: RecX family transcriptional regulator [Pseudomonadota bacterium]
MPNRRRQITAAGLEEAALSYLERYASSAENLRTVLRRRVERAARAGAEAARRAAGAALVDALIERFLRAGLLDDRAYAQGRARTLHRRGRSRSEIARALAAKGVRRSDIDSGLADLAAETVDPDLAAAVALARRRRLGPFRAGRRAAWRAKDLAALGRAGFDYELACRVVDAASPAALARLKE